MGNNVNEGNPPRAKELLGEAGAEAAKAFAQRAEPLVDELRHQARIGVREGFVVFVGGALAFLALELAAAGGVEHFGRRIGRGNAALIAAALAAGGAGTALWVAVRKQPGAPGRRILERVVATLRAMTGSPSA